MPFCPQCGSQVDDDSRFCKQCGAAVTDQEQADVSVPAPAPDTGNTFQPEAYPPVTSSYNVQQKDAKTACLNELDRMINYFEKKQSVYDQYDLCVKNIEYYSNPGTQIKISAGTGTVILVAGIVLTVNGFVDLTGLGCLYKALSDRLASASGIRIIFLLVLLAGLILVITGKDKLTKNRNKRRDEKQRLIEENGKKLSELNIELNEYYKMYGNCLLDLAYTNPKILKELRKLISMGKADSIEKAVNIWNQTEHK